MVIIFIKPCVFWYIITNIFFFYQKIVLFNHYF